PGSLTGATALLALRTWTSNPQAGRYLAKLKARWTPIPPAGGNRYEMMSSFCERAGVTVASPDPPQAIQPGRRSRIRTLQPPLCEIGRASCRVRLKMADGVH